MIGLRLGKSIRAIARDLHRNPSVISREVRGNRTEDGRYQAYWAHSRSARRRAASRRRERIAEVRIREFSKRNSPSGGVPEQIAQAKGHRRAPRGGKPPRGVWSLGSRYRSEQRKRRGAHGALSERVLGLTLLEKLPRCAPIEMNAALTKRLKDLPPELRRSLTFDNGQENRRHGELRDSLRLHTYFCNPYSSWEKGSIENAIGLTRRVWPKRTDYASVDERHIAALSPSPRFDLALMRT